LNAYQLLSHTSPTLCNSVAVGVAIGISAGVLKILQGWNLTYMLLITYAIAIALTVRCIALAAAIPRIPFASSLACRLYPTRHSRASLGTAPVQLPVK
jgi:hypothetical protein